MISTDVSLGARALTWKALSGSRNSCAGQRRRQRGAQPQPRGAAGRWIDGGGFRMLEGRCRNCRAVAVTLPEEAAARQHQGQIVAGSRIADQDQRGAARCRPASRREPSGAPGRPRPSAAATAADVLQPGRHLLHREIDAGKERHRRDDQGEVVGEKVVALGERVEDERRAMRT